MSQTWNQGYFTDVGYTYGYFREVSPVFQQFCLLLRGWAAPAATGTPAARHCELGFGQGLSAAIHAAANPGHYAGTDFTPSHAAHAQGLARAAGSDALLLDNSFEELLGRTDLPAFDSISLHGIWTWVSAANRQVITEFAHQRLKPGGVLYVSYNCFPGWAPTAPLRQLFALHDRLGVHTHETGQRVQAALAFSEALLAAQPHYLRAVPQASERLKKIAAQNPQYLAHEYFNSEWNCMYFTDVAQALASAKLDWTCTAVPLDAVDVVNLTQQGQDFLRGLGHPLLREQARDYFVNQQFRKDLFVRGARRLSAAEQREQLLNTRFVLLCQAADVPLKVMGALGEAGLQEQVYRPFIDAFAADHYAPKLLRSVGAHLPWGQLHQMVAILSHMGALAPCHSEEVERSVRARCKALNRHLCERARYGGELASLASPVTGSGVGVSRFSQLFLLARDQGHKQPADWARFAWKWISEQNLRLVKDDKELETAEENLAELTSEATRFANGLLPVLRALQVAA